MAINKYHQIGEINNIRCSIVEKSVDNERAEFLKLLLSYNGYEVVMNESDEGKFDLGVTDLLFNTEMAIYGRYLKTQDGKVVTPEVWKKTA